MVTNLVNRLRDYVENTDDVPLRMEAAGEVERLRSAITDLLEQCDDYFHGDSGFPLSEAMERARAALRSAHEPSAEHQPIDAASFPVKSSGLMSVWRCKPCGTEHAENVNECSLCGSSDIVPLQVSRSANEA